MTNYSNSRLNTFDTCPYQYWLRYIAKVEPEFDQSEEAFLGSMVHLALEKLYNDKSEGKIDSFTEICRYYDKCCRENRSSSKIKATSRDGLETLLERGQDMLASYYRNVFIDDDRETVETEGQHIMELPDGNGYHIRMDRLCRKDGVYYVCDYKTGSSPGSQYAADADAQLPMYALWVYRNFPDAKEIRLVWYMLKKSGNELVLTSRRSLRQMEDLEKETVLRIKDIECSGDFPLIPGPLCKWCLYEQLCHPDED